jgi:asparagine synthase (glutamine-hydrolysing)
MCGITGAAWFDPDKALDTTTLNRMTEVLRHRGPDAEGQYSSEYRLHTPYGPQPGVALGFRRLSIIDLQYANQPIPNEDETIWVVFNGEIYNFPELRHRLEGAGHHFRTNGDGETIVHLYEDEGVNCFSHLNGMFAVAIWDSQNRQLVLGRDRLGQKPLVYCHQDNRLLFASELKSLLQVPGLSREIDSAALDQYITYQYVPHPRTIFQDIRKLPPGHHAVYREGHLEVQQYWNPNFNACWTGTQEEAIEELRSTLRSSVDIRMQSDVPLGAFLSGGVDSSLIVAIMQDLAREPVRTFSIGFNVGEYDETRYARQVADHLGTEHQEFQVTPDGVSILPKLVWHYDEPFADSSAIPTWYVSELTRQHVTVSLTGDGGDELFAGYPRYKAVALGERLDHLGPLKRLFSAPFWQRIPSSARQKSKLRQWKRFTEVLGKSSGRRYLDWISIFNESRRIELYSDQFMASLPDEDPYLFLQNAMQVAASRDPVTQISLTDLLTYLPCDLMTKVDIASMAHSLECRQPFLDFRLVELAATFPISWKLRGSTGKRILRRAFDRLLPNEIWMRKKMGFGVPLDHWFRGDLKPMTHDLLLSETSKARGFFRPEYIERLVREHEQSQFDHAHRLWSLLVLELWMQTWCDSPIQSSTSSR